MTAIAFYLLKVILCSGILFLYYFLALRNKHFHQWNRFFLLSAVVLSLLLPLLQIKLTADQSDAGEAWRILQSLQQADNTLEELVVADGHTTAAERILRLVFGFISLFFLGRLLFSLWRIRRIIRTHTNHLIDGVRFVNTEIQGTPFSFFRYIFWNKKISLKTSTGQQIFRHEQVHVEQHHTLDKLMLQVVLLFFWCNPFFWLIRKELDFIHEFIADQKAVGDKDTETFAKMILQVAYPQQFASVINPFFQHAIKRRIIMLTKNQKSGMTYLSRVVALPLVAITAFAFTVRTNELAGKEQPASLSPASLFQSENRERTIMPDTLPRKQKEISTVDIRKNSNKKVSEITIAYSDGTKETLTPQEAEKRGLLNNSGKTTTTLKPSSGSTKISVQNNNAKEPLYLLEGKEITREEMEKIDPTTIESVNVLKDKSATGTYGEKGKNGVIEITLKKG